MNKHPKLTAEQRAKLDAVVLAEVSSVAPEILRFADIVHRVQLALDREIQGGSYDYYSWCSAAVQRLKASGQIEHNRSPSGWTLKTEEAA